jgi:hypothetical protein
VVHHADTAADETHLPVEPLLVEPEVPRRPLGDFLASPPAGCRCWRWPRIAAATSVAIDTCHQ